MDGTWLTRDKRRIKIEDMETRHVFNAIMMVERCQSRGVKWRLEYLPSLYKEMEKRNGMRQKRNA